ncbi:MAG: preprotein translocase subunit SecE [Saprospiraceae bacterium]|jgi:preprotein translocase subunit SecE|uniref:preprotein translocase subunit SecE n=1 Tax=Candidatus Brachybacter algidus TaxID=2982024 RepID=UPI001B475954|nr:preprotein translocase subunit SecE [Candidatus Brachybacter algidus]MBP7305122.1 preprotein translocase subunit SecE [Saprospiraceae bacterium]MBK6375341.1 preprotein translocase subunit SecE [Candidatus Brachybacter algidus]MBK6449691.1 preprotein translocase subunit SecE [Candidatus Brachybacter algidus]MBK7604419.1 preprotein translocase subunit SecE [Candidatus Brachybacter algidus]MBK8355416.1 preprotein translocase subunit SecE [Candidatus Brachybacter algidus]
MDKLTTYIKDSYDELIHKVEWPERNVLLESTIAVIVGLLIITVFVFIMDGGINTLVDFIYKIK